MRQWFGRLAGWWWRRTRRTWDAYPAGVFRDGRLCGVPLVPYLERFARDGVSPGTVAGCLWLSYGIGGDPYFQRYRDAMFGFILTVGSRAAAIIAWEDVTPDIIQIKQIQGVQGASELLRPLRWEKMLVQIVLDWAAANGKTQVRMQPAVKNRWYDQSRAQRFRMLYDVTARRMGFRTDEKGEYHFRNLAPA